MTDLLLIDGHSLAYRAFYALPEEMRTASGQVTNAVYGFTSMLINLLRDHRPERVAVAFDLPGGTFRHERLDSYKANRSAPPEIFREQLGLLRQVLGSLGVQTVDAPGFEADDVLATLASQAHEQKLGAAIVTGDRDAFQLVAMQRVTVLYPRRGISDHDVCDAAAVLERPAWSPRLRGIRGAPRRPSDNLPGVPGVGPKTAARLINTFGGIDGIYAHLDDHSPKLRSSLAESRDTVQLNCELMELRRDVELGVSVADLALAPPDVEGTRRLFDFLEFGSLLGRLSEALGVEFAPAASVEVLEVAVEPAASPRRRDRITELVGGSVPAVRRRGPAGKAAQLSKAWLSQATADPPGRGDPAERCGFPESFSATLRCARRSGGCSARALPPWLPTMSRL